VLLRYTYPHYIHRGLRDSQASIVNLIFIFLCQFQQEFDILK